MSRKWLLSLIVLVVCAVVFVPISDARFDLKVVETATTISFQQLNPTVVLSVDNGYTRPLAAVVRVELLKPSHESIASAETALTLKSGNQKVQLVLPVETRELTSKDESNLLWYRLHYTIMPKTAGPRDVPPSEGFISLSEITPELFELRVAGPWGVREGTVYQAVVHAAHPITDGPAKGVQIKASATLTDDVTKKDLVLTDAAITDGEGYAVVKFQLPPSSTANEFQLLIEGTRGFVTARAEEEIEINLHGDIAVSTDKPIYQPGQTLHARALLLGASKRALADRNVTLKIKDPEQTVVFSVELKTSRFGIASADWPIPDHTRLGRYLLEFSTGEDQYSYATVKVSRYDLPNFVVNVKTDRPYYLPGQNATITVRGDYLFGEPVMRGKVRVVRDLEQTWNYREQKYETTEGEVFNGELNSNQTFTVRVPLSDDFENLDGSYTRFKDLNFTAFVTDASTNRTEQRRFDLRISREAIHVYATRPGDSYRESPALPLVVYVSTFYPDGTPARCNVLVTGGDPDDYEPDEKPRVIARLKTNQYGVGKFSQTRVAAVEDSSSLNLYFTARDRNYNKGTREEDFGFDDDDPGIRISTTKTVYAPGEQILANITTTEPSMTLMLDVVRDWSVIHSQLVHVRDRRTSILLPYKPEFKGQITLVAHAEKDEDDRVSGSRTIIYPHPHDLKLKLQPSANTYRPGDQAHVSFKALNAAGSSVESALGIVVFDKAVEERARTDAERGQRYTNFIDEVLSLSGYGDLVGNVSVKTLEKLDLSKPVPVDLDLAAEILLNRSSSYYFESFVSEHYTKDHRSVFAARLTDQLEPLRRILASVYENTKTYPTDESSLRRMASNNGLDFDAYKDVWGMPYRPSFTVERDSDLLVLASAGADKRFDTADDITSTRIAWPYFRPTGEAINKAVESFHQRTGGFIRDFKTLRDEVMPLGIDLDTLRDRWLKPYVYTFDIVGSNLLINVASTDPSGYPFSLWQSRIDYFAETRARIDSALQQGVLGGRFPETTAAMRDSLLPVGVDIDKLRDLWGNPYYVTFKTISFYGDQTRMEVRNVSNGQSNQRLDIKPITYLVLNAQFRSVGADGKEGTPDDFDVATFSGARSQQSAAESQPRAVPIITTFSGATGVIAGTVTDNQGAAIPGAKVSATAPGISEVFTATTNDEGRYLLRNLPPATYQVSVEAPPFKAAMITSVVVRATTVFELNVALEVGAVTETVTVSAGAEATITTRQLTALPLNGRSASNLLLDGVSRNGAKKPLGSVVTKTTQQPFSTPRLREYFPETLVWQPELTTDKKGRAQLDFKLADNITTWKMAVIGSTETGEIGVAETEIKTFQPFFAELDPPQVLTQGDQISLPVVLRNYLPHTQTVDLELKPENWFSASTTRKKTDVAARDSATQFFDIQATSSITKGKQRVTALGSDFSDAIEKSVMVHPDGEEKSLVVTDLLELSTNLKFDLPSETITNSAQVQLKVYPNLVSHVWESVEAILQRPYGCGEQTISSTYPSLLVLRYLKQTKQESPLGAKAQRYLQAGYQRLLSYQVSDGGFTYWGHGDGDVALTAYAIRFLTDATEFTDVDTDVINRAREWLVKQQRPDGSWTVSRWDRVENERQTGMLTALLARSLGQGLSCSSTANATSSVKLALTKSLDYLERRSNEIDEPYLIASYSLAASNACELQRAAKANNRLRDLAKQSTRGSYWSLETNTPFYGWGAAGRVETTALAVQALAQERIAKPQATTNDDSIDRGLLFLLREKDRYGVWYSGQATINVLNTLLTIMAAPGNVNDSVEVFVNNQKINSIPLPANQQMASPLMIDLTSSIRPGANTVELKRTGAGAAASVQIVGTYWIPWTTTAATNAHADSQGLRLNTRCDKTDARVMEQITCRVKAERVGSRGHGMLLAEIGLPPGADVDRASLDAAIKTNQAIDQYDILPDRVIVYLWPQAGGSEFEFKFKPRMAMNAQSAASVLYDYYNPEARTTVAPTRFVVK